MCKFVGNKYKYLRYFIYLQYDGTAYHGWQSQPNATSVQETIEQKLSLLLQRELFIVGAGRTDAGVHARLMVAHVEVDPSPALPSDGKGVDSNLSSNSIDCIALTKRLNGILPKDISIIKIVPVKDDAHARFSPISRTYRYYVTTHKNPFNQYAYRIFWDLDIDLMNEAANKLFDYIDFTSFSRLHTDVKTNNCRIMEARWTETAAGEYVFVIKADRFLRNMVRAVVGTLMLVGRHRMTVDDFCRIIEGKDRCKAGESAPANALFLEDIEYPEDLFI